MGDLYTSGAAITKRTYNAFNDKQSAHDTRRRVAYILWPPERYTRDALHLLETETKESLAGLALGARLDLVERSLGGGILLVVVVVIMIVLVLVLVLRVVGVDLFDSGGHLVRESSVRVTTSAADAVHPSRYRGYGTELMDHSHRIIKGTVNLTVTFRCGESF